MFSHPSSALTARVGRRPRSVATGWSRLGPCTFRSKQGSATIYAYLGERPVDGYPVTFAVSTSAPALAVVSGAATVTFDAHTWNDGIPVTVVGVTTKGASGVVGYTVDFNLVKTDDPSYTESLLVSQVDMIDRVYMTWHVRVGWSRHHDEQPPGASSSRRSI